MSMFGNESKKWILLAYLGLAGFYVVSLTVLMAINRISEQTFLSQVPLVLTGIGALLIRPEQKDGGVTLDPETVTEAVIVDAQRKSTRSNVRRQPGPRHK